MSQTVGIDRPVLKAVGAGAVAWIVGVVITYGLAVMGTFDDGFPISNLLEAYPITVSLGLGLDLHTWFIGSQVPNFEPAVYTLIPIVLLLAAGVATAYGRLHDSSIDAATTGALVVAGYLLAIIVHLVLMSTVGSEPPQTGNGESTQIPQFLVTAIVYPVVFGAIGGAISEYV